MKAFRYLQSRMAQPTRKIARYRRRRTRRINRPSFKIQHHHMLLRLELETCPHKDDKEKVAHMIQTIIHDIGMKNLAAPHVYYVSSPKYNEGLTGIAPIETSHIAFHFWTNPDSKILHTSKSKCLLEFDIYTCGTLTTRQVGRVLHHLTLYKPTWADITILNRNTGLTIERHMHWSQQERNMSWVDWLNTSAFN